MIAIANYGRTYLGQETGTRELLESASNFHENPRTRGKSWTPR